ncbi:MAG: hypothetical protein ACK5OX_17755, partial [Desertimonas sp.]
ALVAEGTVGADAFAALGISCGEAAPSVAAAERVRFDSGTSEATVQVSLGAGVPRPYVLEAMTGQLMTVVVSDPSVAIAVSAPDGSQIGTANAETSVSLPVDGDYRVTLTGTTDVTVSVTFRIVNGSPDTPGPVEQAPAGAWSLGAPPAGTSLQNPVEVVVDGGRFLTDGRFAIALPSQRAAITSTEDGRVVTIGDGVATVLGPDGSVLATAPCDGCVGAAVQDDRVVTVRDPGAGDQFDVISRNLADLSEVGVITATRRLAEGEWVESERQYWDVPIVLAADAAGVVVAYDHRPGGMNAQGGDEAVIARYGADGTLTAATIIGGRVDGGALSPDGTRVAIELGGSSGACYSHLDGGVVELATLEVSLPSLDDPDDRSTWYQLSPYWDGGVMRLHGARFDEETSGGAYCDNITVTPWEASYDTATGAWQQGPAAVLTRWVGPTCADVIEFTVVSAGGGPNFERRAVAGVDGGERDLGVVGSVGGGRGPSSCDPAPLSAPATTVAPPPAIAGPPPECVNSSFKPEEIGPCLLDAWQRGDRDNASVHAEPQPIEELFAIGSGSDWSLASCGQTGAADSWLGLSCTLNRVAGSGPPDVISFYFMAWDDQAAVHRIEFG